LRTVLWIASYPKSGNTWVRFLASNLLTGSVDSAATLNRLIPDLHELRGVIEPPRRRLLMKTHFLYSPALPLAAHTAGAIYVVRDPADVLLSNFYYAERSGSAESKQSLSFERYFEDFLAAGGDPRWLKLGMGSWQENVRSWVGAIQEFPVLLIRYEDLLSDGLNAATAVCRFLGLTRTPAQIAAAVDASSFDRMKEIEEIDIRARRIGIFYKPYLEDSIASGRRFMRRGTAAEAAQTFTEEQRLRFDAVYGHARREMGYAF